MTNYTMHTILLLPFLLFITCNKGVDAPSPTPPSISIADARAVESSGKIIFTVSLSVASQSNVMLNYATVDGTAKAGADYIAKTDGSLLFGPNETQKNIEIALVNDDNQESTEAFEVLLFNPVNASLNKSLASGTMIDEDQGAPFFIPGTGYTTPTSYPGMNLIWADEFDDATLNSANWTHETGTGQGGWGNNELQYYRPDNTYMQSGNLIIEAKKENFGGANYTSSRIVTKGKQSFKYGRIDIRAALPKGQGLWPALWMLGDNIDQVGWPACGETDIMELIGNLPGRVYGTAHYGASWAEHQSKSASRLLPGNATFYDEFHVFSLIWEQDRMRWLVDDMQYHEITPSDLGAAPYPFNAPQFFIFNVAVGGNWPGSPDGSTVFPQRMIVDYVRVFQ